MRYYISDLHFFHKALLTQCDRRGFATVEEMHDHIVEVWNAKIHRTDDVILLGDVSFGTGEQTNEILDRLKGKLYLIEGNHDDRYLEDRNFRRERFEWIRPYAELNDHGRKVVLSHFPIMCYNLQYRLNDHGDPRSYMLYGHVHNTLDYELIRSFQEITRQTEVTESDGTRRKIPCNMINCFCMRSGYVPLTLNEWIALEEQEEAGD